MFQKVVATIPIFRCINYFYLFLRYSIAIHLAFKPQRFVFTAQWFRYYNFDAQNYHHYTIYNQNSDLRPFWWVEFMHGGEYEMIGSSLPIYMYLYCILYASILLASLLCHRIRNIIILLKETEYIECGRIFCFHRMNKKIEQQNKRIIATTQRLYTMMTTAGGRVQDKISNGSFITQQSTRHTKYSPKTNGCRKILLIHEIFLLIWICAVCSYFICAPSS